MRAMVLRVREAWRSASQRGTAASQRKHAHKLNGLRYLVSESSFTAEESFRESVRMDIPMFGESFQELRRHECPSVSTCSSGIPLSWCGGRLHRNGNGWLGFSRNRAGGFNFADFLKQDNSRNHLSLFLGFSALALLGATVSYAEDENSGLQAQPQAKSNIHTAKWRIYTDKARELCGQGSFDNAEKYFYRALDEAKLGFGEEDPHVASCYNNLAELFRIKKEYDKAEPLYLEAVKRLRESSGTEDGSVGFALHNLGGFYLLQRKLEHAQRCYEEALKIKGRALGLDHPEYANTMFHLGEVIRIRGDTHDGLALIRDSIRILEQVGLGNTTLAVKRLTRFSELLVFAGELREAEAVQRKILQVVEFSKDFTFSDMVAAIENLSAILQKQGKLDESVAFLEQTIKVLRDNKGSDDIQVAVALSKLGGVYFQQGMSAASQKDSVQALARYEKADGLLCKAVAIAEQRSTEVGAKRRKTAQGDASHHALLLAHCLTVLGNVRIHKLDLLADGESSLKACKDAESVLRRSVSLLEEMIVEQGNQSGSDVWKLYKECSRYLDDLSRKMSEL